MAVDPQTCGIYIDNCISCVPLRFTILLSLEYYCTVLCYRNVQKGRFMLDPFLPHASVGTSAPGSTSHRFPWFSSSWRELICFPSAGSQSAYEYLAS
jgi:hypothetical protein